MDLSTLLLMFGTVAAVIIAISSMLFVLLELRSLRVHINSRMDQLLDVATTAAFARGIKSAADEREQELKQ